MISNSSTRSKQPTVVLFIQILIYLAVVINLVNGMLTIGDEGIAKKMVSLGMIIFGFAAIWVAVRLSTRSPSRQKNAIVLSIILIVLRIIEFTIWHSVGFLLGILLPVLVIWRLNSPEAKPGLVFIIIEFKSGVNFRNKSP
ncbi:hypothetical protein [Paenibacillus sp. N3.4]|uniref:hypothetical protein n=1 Tax=Paenibacillus sp. N3.4 TaxID=2603222 RepID=UPI00164FC79D|nr:hypothetical protein [Paenibacillus sp. N3.4]